MITDYFAHREEMDYPNFSRMLEDAAGRYPGNTALRMRNGSGAFEELSYRDFDRRVRALSSFMETAGIEKGDRVGLISENRFEWVITYYAAVTRAVLIVPFDIHGDAEALVSYAAFAELKGIFFSSNYAPAAERMAAASPGCSLLYNFDDPPAGAAQVNAAGGGDEVADCEPSGDESSGEQGDGTRAEADAGRRPAAYAGKSPEPTGDDPASIIFTSGTTGSPKGVTLSQHGIIANVNASIMSLPIDERDNFVAVLPFHHTYPTTCSMVSPLSVGGSVTIVDKIVGPRIVADVRDSGGTTLIGVPLLFDKLRRGIETKLSSLPEPKRTLLRGLRRLSAVMGHAGIPAGRLLFRGLRRTAGLSSLRLLVSGGGPLAAETAAFFEELGFTIVQGYGMSENGPLITTNTVRHRDNRSAGLPVKHTQIRIAEQNADGVGEIQVKSPSLMIGYYKNPGATRDAFTDDGWLRTGDLGYLDDRGFLFISGRNKNLIVTTGGKNVYPEEVEEKFPEDGVIREVLVMGQRIEGSHGERVIAVCVPDREKIGEMYGEPPWEEVERLVRREVESVNRRLEAYRKIDRTYVREKEFEKTASEKVKRYLYREYGDPAVSSSHGP